MICLNHISTMGYHLIPWILEDTGHCIPKDFMRYNLGAHQQLINRSKEQIVRQGWEPEGVQLVRFPNSRPVFET